MKRVVAFLYGFVTLFCLIASCILFSVYFTWGSTVDLSLIIANIHMVQTVSLSYYWKEILLSCIYIILGIIFFLQYKKIGICLLTLMIFWFIFYLRPLYIPPNTKGEALYEKNYVIPKVFRGKKQKNIIYISMESMSSLWTYEKVIGTKETLIPNLLKLREENQSFKGWNEVIKMAPTIPSFAASICGVTSPPISYNSLKLMWKNENFGGVPKAVCISDFFKKNDYKIIYIMGGNLKEERADLLTSNHSFDDMYGKRELKELGYFGVGAANHLIPDSILLEFAKNYLSKFPENRNFFLSIILGNTHGPDIGYTEAFCDKHYNGDIRDAYRCMDKIVFDFVNWCKKQPFFKDTIIFLVGDHIAWDVQVKKNGLNFEARKQYPQEETLNIIVDGTKTISKTIQKDFSQVDFAPTILESAGFVLIPRVLGLGVSLYDTSPTLVQNLGIKKFKEELKNDKSYWSILYGEDTVSTEK